MKTEELRALGLSDKQIAAVMKQNGADVENVKTKYSDYDDLKKQLGEADETIQQLKGKAGDVETVQRLADQWKAKAEQADKDAKAKVDALRFDFALERALVKAGAKNPKAARALLELDKLKLGEDGGSGEYGAVEIAGLKEQLDKVKKDNGFLFEDGEGKPAPRFSTGTGGKGEPVSDAAVRAVMGLPNGG